MYGLLCPNRIEFHKGINVVERVEQKMRIDLVFEVLKFGFRFCFFELFAFIVELYPVNTHFNGNAQSCNQRKRKHIAEDEGKERRRFFSSAQGTSIKVEAVDEFVGKVHEEGQSDDEQKIDDDEFFGFPTKKKFIDEIEVVNIENGHEAQQDSGRSPEVGPAENVSSVEEKQREAKDNEPHQNMDKYVVYRTFGIFLVDQIFLIYHIF